MCSWLSQLDMAKLTVCSRSESSQIVCQSIKKKKVNIVAETKAVHIIFSCLLRVCFMLLQSWSVFNYVSGFFFLFTGHFTLTLCHKNPLPTEAREVPWRGGVAWWAAVGSGGDQGAGGHVRHLQGLPLCHPSPSVHVGL